MMESYIAKLGERVVLLETALKNMIDTHNALAKEFLQLKEKVNK